MTADFSHSPQEQRTVLCVDDEAIIRGLCASALEDYRVLTVDSAQEALKLLENEHVDIVLSDIIMPNVSGLELLKKIKEQQPDQAVILMTGYSDKNTILEALKAGADDFINKPINILQLCTTVDKTFEKQKIRQELSNLKRIYRLKSDFLGLISHKLKTPTTAISLFIQNIADGVESPHDENFKQMLSLVQAETEHLEQLIQDLLYFSEATLESEDMPLEELDLGQLAGQIAVALKTKAAERDITLRIELAPDLAREPLPLNPQRINFAIRALLDNALKFTPAGGSVSIEGRVEEHQLSLTISDTGVGIPASELPKIFNKFYQIDPHHTGQVRGFGLGLFYARDFIRDMGGLLEIESEPEHGTRVRISFPRPS